MAAPHPCHPLFSPPCPSSFPRQPTPCSPLISPSCPLPTPCQPTLAPPHLAFLLALLPSCQDHYRDNLFPCPSPSCPLPRSPHPLALPSSTSSSPFQWATPLPFLHPSLLAISHSCPLPLPRQPSLAFPPSRPWLLPLPHHLAHSLYLASPFLAFPTLSPWLLLLPRQPIPCLPIPSPLNALPLVPLHTRLLHPSFLALLPTILTSTSSCLSNPIPSSPYTSPPTRPFHVLLHTIVSPCPLPTAPHLLVLPIPFSSCTPSSCPPAQIPLPCPLFFTISSPTSSHFHPIADPLPPPCPLREPIPRCLALHTPSSPYLTSPSSFYPSPFPRLL